MAVACTLNPLTLSVEVISCLISLIKDRIVSKGQTVCDQSSISRLYLLFRHVSVKLSLCANRSELLEREKMGGKKGTEEI